MTYKDKGLFIVVDGPDGSGKTTLIKDIISYFNQKYPHHIVKRTCEKTDTALGRLATDMMHGEWTHRDRLAATTRWMLYEASRAQTLYERVIPYLEQGFIVVQDRYIESTVAYQSADCRIDYRTIAKVALTTVQHRLPDITFVTDCKLPTLMGRLEKRDKLSYFEAKGPDFLRMVRDVYLRRAEEHRLSWAYNIRVINTEVEKGTAINQCTELIDHWVHNKVSAAKIPSMVEGTSII